MSVKQQSVSKEYEKNPSIKKEDIKALAEWLNRQPHLPNISELDLILFYYSCENSMELTKTTIDIHFTMRTHLNAFFTEMDPTIKKNIHTLDTLLLTPFTGTTKDGNRIFYCRLMDNDPANFFLENAAKLVGMLIDLWQYEEGTFPGIVIMVDMDKVTLGHVGRLSILSVKRIVYYLQEAMPVILKGFHFINTPSFMDKILIMIRPFLKENFSKLLHLHSAPIDSIYKQFPKEHFPKNMGGDWETFEKIQSDVKTKVMNNRDFFIEKEKIKVDESKRPGKLNDDKNIFGIDGSFKKLDID